MLTELIRRYRDGELSLDEFATTAAENFVHRNPAATRYPETDSDPAIRSGVSSVTIANAVDDGDLTADEAQAIYDALPDDGT